MALTILMETSVSGDVTGTATLILFGEEQRCQQLAGIQGSTYSDKRIQKYRRRYRQLVA